MYRLTVVFWASSTHLNFFGRLNFRPMVHSRTFDHPAVYRSKSVVDRDGIPPHTHSHSQRLSMGVGGDKTFRMSDGVARNCPTEMLSLFAAVTVRFNNALLCGSQVQALEPNQLSHLEVALNRCVQLGGRRLPSRYNVLA